MAKGSDESERGQAHRAAITSRPSGKAEDQDIDQDIVVRAARSILPLSALPLTVDIIDKQALDQRIESATPRSTRSRCRCGHRASETS